MPALSINHALLVCTSTGCAAGMHGRTGPPRQPHLPDERGTRPCMPLRHCPVQRPCQCRHQTLHAPEAWPSAKTMSVQARSPAGRSRLARSSARSVPSPRASGPDVSGRFAGMPGNRSMRHAVWLRHNADSPFCTDLMCLQQELVSLADCCVALPSTSSVKHPMGSGQLAKAIKTGGGLPQVSQAMGLEQLPRSQNQRAGEAVIPWWFDCKRASRLGA